MIISFENIVRFVTLSAIAFACTVLYTHAQKVYTPASIPDVHRYDGRKYVSDPENILSPATVSRLNAIAAQLEASSGVETAIVVVPSIGTDTPESFTVSLFELWGIGKKGSDNGLLILLATEDRLVRFEVGYGLEGILTDAMSRRIQTQRMNQYFAAGDWDAGLLAGLDAIQELLTDPSSELAEAQTGSSDESFITGLLLVLGLMIAISVAALISYRRARKCPRCGHKMEVVNESTQRVSPGVKRITTVMRCPNCGYTTTKNRTENMAGPIVGGTIGGLGGLGRGGGSFGGGGWGGGRSGGGGATSRF